MQSGAIVWFRAAMSRASTEVVPALVELEVAVPRLTPALR